jgi:hypothetical protein
MARGDIAVQVINDDALDVLCDVLVLKYAQAPYGVDSTAAQRLHLDLTPASLPPGGFRFKRVVDDRIAADAVLFVGVVPLREFRYREIREFTAKALRSLAGEAPDVSHLALTLHGPGYGLDEQECFMSELAGVVDAIVSGDLPHKLQRISFVERNPGRAARLTELLGTELPQGVLEPDPRPLQQRLLREGSSLRSVGFDSSDKPLVFVAMPINENTEDLFHYGIERPIDQIGGLCERIDKDPGTGDLLDRVRAKISSATIVVAELTGSNPNVFLEVGFAWGKGIRTLLLVSREAVVDLPFDVKTQSCLVYDSIQDLENKLHRALETALA